MKDYKTQDPKEFYDERISLRQPYIDRAENYAKITLPYLFVEDGHTGSDEYEYNRAQSFCGRLVNNLKSKMGMALFPPATPSFRLEPDSEALRDFTEGDRSIEHEAMKMVSAEATRINKHIEQLQIRDSAFDIVAQLIAIGPVVIEKGEDGEGIIHHTLRNINVQLNKRGDAEAMCVLETISELPDGFEAEKKEGQDTAEYELYSLLYKESKDVWILKQQIGDTVGQEITYNDKTRPFEYIGWNWSRGDYMHRPYVEDYYEDMVQFNKLSKVLTEGAVISSKSLIFVDPRSGRTRIRDIEKSRNGAVVKGRSDDVTSFQLNKGYDFRVALETKEEIKRDLAFAFLLGESVQRDAERVTAEEIRYLANELESSSLSGVYSKLSKKASKRIIDWVMEDIGIGFDSITVNVVTGLDALGRSSEMQKLDAYVSRMSSLGLRKRIDDDALSQRYAGFIGVDTSNLLKSPELIKKEEEAERAALAQQMMAQSAAQEGGKKIVESAQPPAPQQ